MSARTIAIVGAGPGIGFAVAERFGREGFRVALLSRGGDSDGTMQRRLAELGIVSEGFVADVTDRGSLKGALMDAAFRFGGIDVLEYSPVPLAGSMRAPRELDIKNEQFHLDFQPLGAIAAVKAVLPAMISRRAGSLLFTTAASAQHPAAMTASFGVAAGALRNYVRLLHDDLKPAGSPINPALSSVFNSLFSVCLEVPTITANSSCRTRSTVLLIEAACLGKARFNRTSIGCDRLCEMKASAAR